MSIRPRWPNSLTDKLFYKQPTAYIVARGPNWHNMWHFPQRILDKCPASVRIMPCKDSRSLGLLAMRGLQELVLELTDRCPLRCRHCSSESGPRCGNHLPADRVLGLIAEAAELGATQISFGGGEPTGSPLFLSALWHTAALGLCSEVFTCGVSPDGGSLGPLPGRLIAESSGVPRGKFIFSVHGHTPELHDELTRVRGSFDCMLASLDACLASGIACEINFVPLRPNAASFADVIGLAEVRGIRRASLLRFVPQGRGLYSRDELELMPEEEGVFIRGILELRSRTDVEIRTGSPFNGIVPGNSVCCRAGAAKLVVQADGNALPCEVFKHRDRREWRLSVNELSLYDILQSPQLRRLVAFLRQSDCKTCPVHSRLRSSRARGTSCGETEMAFQAE